MIWQRDKGGFGTVASPGLAAAQKDYLENGWYLRDVRAIRTIERSLWLDTDTLTERHVFGDDGYLSDPFYAEFLARHGLKWCAAVGIAPDPHIGVRISI
jgi:hypothetical protein